MTDAVRDVLVTVKQTASSHGLASEAAKAIHALDTERLNAEAEIADTEASLRRMYDRARAAEAERGEARRELAFKKKALRNCCEAHLDAEARITELEAALAGLVAAVEPLLDSRPTEERT